MVYTGAIVALAKRTRAKHVRRSVTLPPKIARQVETLAKERDLSDNRVLVELIEQGIEARQQKEKAFFQLAERFRAADDPEQVKQLGNQLGRFVFGEQCRVSDAADRKMVRASRRHS
jgi:predicted transcriptional regulator